MFITNMKIIYKSTVQLWLTYSLVLLIWEWVMVIGVYFKHLILLFLLQAITLDLRR